MRALVSMDPPLLVACSAHPSASPNRGVPMQLRRSMAALVAVFLSASCGLAPQVDSPAPAASAQGAVSNAAGAPQTELDGLFTQAAGEQKVPVSLLKAISFVETRWQMVKGEEEFEGMPP